MKYFIYSILIGLAFSVNAISLQDHGDGILDIILTNEDPVYGFQFDIQGLTLEDSYGGTSEEFGFMIAANDLENNLARILGFSIISESIPIGSCEILLTVEYTEPQDSIFLPSGSLIFADTNGDSLAFSIGDECDLGLDDFFPYQTHISSIYPNPFNPSVSITYQIESIASTQIQILDLQGREIKSLVNTVESPGEHSVVWTPQNVSSGVYLIQLRSGNISQTSKLLYLK